MKRESLLPILTLASVVDFGALLPKPRVNNCPQCPRGKLVGNGRRYCQRCGYLEQKGTNP